MYTLNRTLITGSLDATITPYCVFKEISAIHGINIPSLHSQTYTQEIADFLHILKTNDYPVVEEPYSQTDLHNIAKFVNPEARWDESSLLTALDNMFFWTNDDNLFYASLFDFHFGLQTPTAVENLNACVLYRIATYNKIRLHPHMNLENLATAVTLAYKSEVFGRNILYQTINYLPRTNYSQVYCEMIKNTESEVDPYLLEDTSYIIQQKAEYDAIVNSYEQLTSKGFLLNRIKPVSSSEAITISALLHKIDISPSCYPTDEIKKLQLGTKSEYIPIDPVFSALYLLNPEAYDLSKTFNPRLPEEIYDESDLYQLAKLEGYTKRDLARDSPYFCLQNAYLTNTFYHGKFINAVNTETTIYNEDIDELTNDEVLCFGMKGEYLVATTYKEICDSLKFYKNFQIPFRPFTGSFSDMSLRKLKNLCYRFSSGESEEISIQKKELLDAINIAELYTDEKWESIKSFFHLYESVDVEDQKEIYKSLICLLHLTMYMRGWVGMGVYPVKKALVEDQIMVDLKTTEAIAEFAKTKYYPVIRDLPLLYYKDGEFYVNSDEDIGLTIGERLDIVIDGESHENYDSCIRLSSNFFAASVYKFMIVLGLNPQFDIRDLRDIS